MCGRPGTTRVSQILAWRQKLATNGIKQHKLAISCDFLHRSGNLIFFGNFGHKVDPFSNLAISPAVIPQNGLKYNSCNLLKYLQATKWPNWIIFLHKSIKTRETGMLLKVLISWPLIKIITLRYFLGCIQTHKKSRVQIERSAKQYWYVQCLSLDITICKREI